MKKNQKLLLLLLMMAMLLPTFAMAETPVIVNLVENPDAEYHFEDGAKILEIVFPRVYSSDCILLRYDVMVMMIDASTKNATMRNRIYTACDTLGIDHIDIAYNSHPHDDHIDGFQFVNEYAPISKFLITFPEDFNARMKSTVKFMKANNIPIEQIGNGDTFTLGEDGGVVGFLLALRPGTAYDSPNYGWFCDRYDDFLYIDRIVMDPCVRGRGLGKTAYCALFDFARDHGIGRLVAEIDSRPPNGPSLSFHRAMGFV